MFSSKLPLTFNSVVWYLPIETDMFYMEFDLDFMKTHGAEKSNKCNQCDYILTGKQFEDTS